MKRLIPTLLLLALVPLLACTSAGSDGSPAQPSGPSSDDNPLYSFTLMRQGSLLLQQGRYTDALKRFQEADRLKPGNATVHNMMGLCYLRMQQHDQAIAAFSRALDMVPSFTDARNNRGATYLAIGQYNLAEVDFLAVLADTTYPHRWSVYYNLGMTYLQRGQYGAAEENLRRAAYAPSPVFDAFLRLAEIAVSRGKNERALTLLEEARLEFPDRPEAALELGRLLLDEGRVDEGREILEKVERKNPGTDSADQARALLEGG